MTRDSVTSENDGVEKVVAQGPNDDASSKVALQRHAAAGNNKNNNVKSLDPSRHNFHTKLSLYMTVASLAGLCLLSALYAPSHQERELPHTLAWEDSSSSASPEESSLRFLQYNDNNEQDYSSYSCHYIFDETPDAGDAQCRFARTCNQGEGLWASFVFCSEEFSRGTLILMVFPWLLIWLVLLFRMLGSTAEDYFSPALEMFSLQLGLPPRFAGVTLLALGNGAADVSATISAITSDPDNGYKLALGALTGAAMVIGSVVSALVVMVAGGLPCRGALVRDVSALGIAVLIVWLELHRGVVGPDTVTFFVALYVVFVLTVLAADVYHRAVVLPRRQADVQEAERQRQLEAQRIHEQEQGEQNPGEIPAVSTAPTPIEVPSDGIPMPGSRTDYEYSPPSRFSTILMAFSNYDNPNSNGDGVESEELDDQPIVLHGAHGLLNPRATPAPDHHLDDNPNLNTAATNTATDAGDPGASDPPTTAYSILEDVVDRSCIAPGSFGVTSDNICQALIESKDELLRHAEQVWDDIAYNGDVDHVTKYLLILELPFTIARKITVTIPCDGYYNRGLIALSFALSPFWFGFYLWNNFGVSVFDVLYIYIPYVVLIFVGAILLLRFAPSGDDARMALSISAPLAFYGFVLAATWIDTVADALVSVLDFVGIILRIPGPIVGLTILAWGNSMSDLSADITMARKGLANMAMTACFAGPFFNILVGLGLGFSTLAARTQQAERNVSVAPSVACGFLFIFLNSIVLLITGLGMGKGRIPKKYGYIAITLYSIYVVSAIALQYSKYGDDDDQV